MRYPRLSRPALPTCPEQCRGELQRRQDGRKHDKLNGLTWNSHLLISGESLELRQDPCYYCFPEPLVMFFMQREGKLWQRFMM